MPTCTILTDNTASDLLLIAFIPPQSMSDLHRSKDGLVWLIPWLTPQVGLGELVPAVRHLVEYERNSLAAADTIAAAEGVVAAQPDVLLHRIVAQFQHLFDCHRLEGVLPALNQVCCH